MAVAHICLLAHANIQTEADVGMTTRISGLRWLVTFGAWLRMDEECVLWIGSLNGVTRINAGALADLYSARSE
jgi:hypothetical protein